MQEVNWNNFKAKFNGKEQSIFQWLCYLLFCEEYKQPLGISRYANHAGVETDPIKVENDYIGWQAKFYDTRLSEHKDELISAIEKSKSRHPALTKMVFYLNKDFGQEKNKTDPNYKKEIEKNASGKGVSIIWKAASFFESPFVTKDNGVIVKYFFSADKSLFDFISNLVQHSELVLNPIQSDIKFDDKEIKIDRSSVTKSLKESLKDGTPTILSGEGGVGKTAVIKDLYASIKKYTPLFIFKATQFNNLTDVNDLFKSYGEFGINELATAYQDVEEKCIVVDSAEKLSDIEDKDVFKEFVNQLISNKWKIIFTTRYSYLENLRYILISLYGLSFQTIDIKKIPDKALEEFSQQYDFQLPSDSRVRELICNPFYLNEYLQNYNNLQRNIIYTDFKNALWNKKIADSSYTSDRMHIRREECFISLAQKRANEGNFLVRSDGLELSILQKLINDDIVGYESDSRGYFITHDIYEEWALERLVESTFLLNSEDIGKLYEDLGSSLPVRRAFRNWLSEKLVVNKNIVKSLIEASISNVSIEGYWKDEVLVSVLLSDHSKDILELFEDKLLENDASLLIKISFLLRIACKEFDESTLRNYGFQRTTGAIIQTLFTKPKGSGWNYIIDLINRNKEKLSLSNINIILALLEDWNNKYKQGETTKAASLIGLFYYETIAEQGGFGYRAREQEKNIIKIILNGSSEIKEELSRIVDGVVAGGKISHRDKYYELVETMLSSVIDSTEVAQAIPEKILSLANVYWLKDDDSDFDDSLEIGRYFGLATHNQDYFPSSPYQTPILALLRVLPNETIDFILSLTNRTVEYYKNSSLSENEMQEVKVFVNAKKPITQYISCRLWEMYRGTHVAPSLLESIYMALESWLMDIGKTSTSDDLANRCIYLIENSKSAAITSVVASVILAYPFKLFEVALIIFKTKKFFLYDTTRYVKDRTHKGMLESLKNNFPQRDVITEFFQDERIRACDDQHRNSYLENIALYYQVFRSNDETDNQASKRRKIIWKIFDTYYKQLPDSSKETEADKTWRLYLARMDRRKMQPKVEKKDGQTLISFNPDLDVELKKYSESSLKKNNLAMSFSSLDVWSHLRWKRDAEKYKEYTKYESDPTESLNELRRLVKLLKSGSEDLGLMYRSTSVYVCAVLVRDFKDKLKSSELNWCKKILFKHANLVLSDGYRYSIGDGIEASIGSLPYFYSGDSDIKAIKKLLLYLLFDDFPVGMGGDRIKDFSVMIILYHLWKLDSKDANSLFLGFLLLKPKYEEIAEEIRQENISKQIYGHTKQKIYKRLEKKYKKEIENILSNRISYSDLADIEQIELDILNTAFELLPPKTQDDDHKIFLKTVLPVFAQKLTDDERNDYMLSNHFLKKYAYFVLMSSEEEISQYVKPFVDNFDKFRYTSDLFSNFVSVEDEIHQYEEFWIVWNMFYDSVVNMSKEKWQRHNSDSIIHNYLFAWQYWKKDAKKWLSIKDREKLFFKKVVADMGHHTAVLYSISKFLTEIGSDFIDEGITWLSDMLNLNQNLKSDDLEVNTVYYIENIVRRYAFINRHKIKTTPAIKKRLIIILDFLIEKASVTAYLIREDIL